ncbi:unnamed protein product [Pseudo-nitzschia multistriata]|uniref:Trs120/TRAPPC9 N-terminal domain-containing protein n=1 Tax=Pseudo-nitzschia multistriata TaxID=183589 RepID=A0A448ZKC3_9STRA|nr:unnamed protein product [Pseudo-nitzschia multistriata]
MSIRSSLESAGSSGPVRLSQVVGSPTFRSTATNAIAVIPLLSSSHDGSDDPTTHSSKSFEDFLRLLQRHNGLNKINGSMSDTYDNYDAKVDSGSPVVVVVPNSNLTRPSDWKYNETPLRNFHWGHGCQRLRFFDGRPYHSRSAHDRLINHELTRNWIDLCPSRRTAAVVGVLNIRDCSDMATLERAIQEWHQWAERYSTPPYEVTALGRDVERDTVVPRLFVFDSFHEDLSPGVDLQAATKKLNITSNSLVAFPPSGEERSQMMDLHVNVVLNDLAVSVFKVLEDKIRESDLLMTGKNPSTLPPTKTGFFGRTSANSRGSSEDTEAPRGGSKDLSIDTLAKVVGPSSKLASSKTNNLRNLEQHRSASIRMKLDNASTNNNVTDTPSSATSTTSEGSISEATTISASSPRSSVKAQLLTPLDEFWDYTELSPKDAHEMRKREVARREKFAADLSLLAGSPLDAYERYTKAADLCKTTSPDPLWYSSALEGCAAAHIAMADVGGFNVDEYLDSSFQLPEEIMACALIPASEKNGSNDELKKCMPQVVQALCEDALNVTSRHPKTACFHAELLLKLAWYTAEVEDGHLRCQWGLGGDEGGGIETYGGDPDSDKRRWDKASATRLNFLDMKDKDGEDIIKINTLKRLQKCSEFMHMAASTACLDSATRSDVALRCISIAWRGLRPTLLPTVRERSKDRIQLKRKAAFFAVTAAEAMSDVQGHVSQQRAHALWAQASRLLPQTGNDLVGGNYGWATLRAVALHALVIQGTKESSEDAAEQLLTLVSRISPPNCPKSEILPTSPVKGGGRSNSYFAGARSYLRESAKVVAKDARTRSKEIFGNDISSLLVVQAKWVEDDPVDPMQVPMSEFSSDFGLGVIAMPSVWSTIRFENCALAQEQLIQQIFDLRKNIPACTLQNMISSKNNQNLPIEITSIGIVTSDSSTKLERIKLEPKEKKKENAMSTFFNPYAKQERKQKPTTIPRGEEQYISITFTNKLAVPFEIGSCKLKFDSSRSDRIKAPSISFVIPGQTKNFAVQFPFMVLDKLENDDIDILQVKGICITALSRSIYLPLGEDDEPNKTEGQIIPKSLSLYPKRDYTKTSRVEDQESKVIYSPQLEIIPPQPNIHISFASSTTPIDSETIIPVLLADGEIFTLPKMCVSNDTGLGGIGRIEELQISAVGLPGLSDVVLYDMSRTEGNENDVAGDSDDKNSMNDSSPIKISAHCVGLDADTLNSSTSDLSSSFISTKLFASPSMGAQTASSHLTLRFRYRGKAVSSELEVWRKYEVQVHILRVKGPKIPSLSFRCDLFWESGYSELCNALAIKESDSERSLSPRAGSTGDQKIGPKRLDRDRGIHVCSDEVVVMISVANESSSPIILSRMDGLPVGFAKSKMDTLKVSKGVSAKFPIILPRLERTDDICQRLVAMLKFKWKSEIGGSELDDAQETGGPMFPVNYRVREGILEIPRPCLQKIIDENPIFLSRICKAPCSIGVSIFGGSNGNESQQSVKNVQVGKPVDVAVSAEIAEWLSADRKDRTNCTLKFYCARQNSSTNNADGKENASCASNQSKDFVWIGQIHKTLTMGETSSDTDPHRARIVFLSEGNFFVSACLGLSGAEDRGDPKEIWWAEKAGMVRVSKKG